MRTDISRPQIGSVLIIIIGLLAILLAGLGIAFGNHMLIIGMLSGVFLLAIAVRYPFSMLILIAFLTPLEAFTTYQGASLNRYILLILLAVWVAQLLSARKKPYLDGSILGMFAWVALGILSYLWAPTTNNLVQNIFGYFLALMLMITISDLVNNRRQLAWFLGAFLAGQLVFVFMYFLYGQTNSYGFFIPMVGVGSLSSFGNIAGIIIACFIALAFYGRYGWRLLGLLVLLPAGYLFLTSGLRRTILTTAAVIFVLMIFQKRISWKAILTGVFILTVTWYGWNAILPKLPAFLQNRFTVEDVVDTGGSGRLILYNIAWDVWKTSPVLGVGMGNFSFYSDQRFHHPSVPHNAYLEVLSETGLVGFFLWTASFFVILRNSIKTFKASVDFPDQLLAALSLSLLVFMGAAGMVISLEVWRPFWLALGVGIAVVKILNPKILNNQPKPQAPVF